MPKNGKEVILKKMKMVAGHTNLYMKFTDQNQKSHRGVLQLEKVYITPSTMGLVYITPQTMKSSISPPELSKTGQITP